MSSLPNAGTLLAGYAVIVDTAGTFNLEMYAVCAAAFVNRTSSCLQSTDCGVAINEGLRDADIHLFLIVPQRHHE